MKRIVFFYFIFLIFTNLFAQRYQTIEDFESGNVHLFSYPEEDIQPDDYAIVTNNSYQDSGHSLKIWGNTWKYQFITPVVLDSSSVFGVHIFAEGSNDISGIAFSDNQHTLFYSFFGNRQLDIERWVTVYQGVFPKNCWNEYLLPVADDWLAYFDYLPTIFKVIYINDNDSGLGGVTYFDEIRNISQDLPKEPSVSITYETDGIKYSGNTKSLTVYFHSFVTDEDSSEWEYFWQFGDGETSTEANPIHTYNIYDDHNYNVSLQVTDETFLSGFASTQVNIEEGDSSFPLRINFVGDILLARGISGIINTQGYEAVFDPTMPYLGNGADYSVANLECPLTNATTRHPTKPIVFKTSPDRAVALQYAGIDFVNIANNHIYDYLDQGIQDTKAALKEYNIAYAGADSNSYQAYKPWVISKKGLVVSFLSSSDRTGQYNNYQPYLQAGYNKAGFAYMTPYYVKKQIDEVRDFSDLVVVQTHSGSEYSTAPGSDYDKNNHYQEEIQGDEEYSMYLDVPHMWDREIRHFFIDQGADLVVCHHPHIIQGLELYNGKLIAHSLGNFVFDLHKLETMYSMILNVDANENGFYQYSLTPVFIDEFIPKRASNGLGNHILDYLAQKSRELNTILDVDKENCLAKVILDTLNCPTTLFQHSSIFWLKDEDGIFISNPVKLERSGSIKSIENITPNQNWWVRLGKSVMWFGDMEEESSYLWQNNAEYDYQNSHSGERALIITGNSTIQMQEAAKFDNTKEHSVYSFFRAENFGSPRIEANFSPYRSMAYISYSQTLIPEQTGNYNWNADYINVPIIDENFFTLTLINNNGNNNSVAGFDDVDLIEWDSWVPIEQLSQISSPNDYYYVQFKSDEQNMGFGNFTYSEIVYHQVLDENENTIVAKTPCRLDKAYPNPFFANGKSNAIKFNYAVNKAGKIKMNIYNLKGQLVKNIVNDYKESGSYTTEWNLKNRNDKTIASGIYFCVIKHNQHQIEVKKVVIVR